MFDGENLRRFIEQCTWVTVNDYEWQLLKDRTNWDLADITNEGEALIVTRGGEGSKIFTRNGDYEIPIAKPAAVEDRTGCGAYRAGVLYGFLHDLDWETTGQLASLCGSIKMSTTARRTTPSRAASSRAASRPPSADPSNKDEWRLIRQSHFVAGLRPHGNRTRGSPHMTIHAVVLTETLQALASRIR